MERNFYIINMHKILYLARNLHEKGYNNLRVIPSLSSSGMYWRCIFLVDVNGKRNNLNITNWIQKFYNVNLKEIDLDELTRLFITEEKEFLKNAKSENNQYVEWFKNVLEKVKKDELPYAFSDFYSSTHYWKTSIGNKIKIIPGEEKYNF
ncbi:hypothetical protein [Empedobacter sp.]|uniref:hypothetical protein n=1 Tax=Empedobacter sp. TaxID=1927715 RepID=UPI0028A7B93D|nr:hypothetical protein [Empedobacter sp.]